MFLITTVNEIDYFLQKIDFYVRFDFSSLNRSTVMFRTIHVLMINLEVM